MLLGNPKRFYRMLSNADVRSEAEDWANKRKKHIDKPAGKK